ncbi:MAG: alpha-amylase [Bacteroidetes bacterium GWF2_42_66]|nr:MAG: alpha-amylase [Bacteroidetes bacterium GWA2_42_15]OFX97103.1 MAG: alpha-amylase [Bacteroidetes bacterium GWE2_42_39]OFY46174.1 MAG: alpha-amylase [Bacteroidetes bacterium GWF2_42_66]HBL78060.1 alpha-amylase [Prolixibacteraceae bacterium]HCR90993.1 alpha-amylase [Prolixibacteraceae bacterium]
MRAICFYFQVHQPFRYRRYRFFDIGNDHYYYDDFANESILRKVADRCYLPANKLMLELVKKHKGKFKIAYSISGLALEQFDLYTPEVLDSFRALAETGHVEFLSETYSHSLVALKNKELFIRQIQEHDALIEKHFGQKPTVFRNTELVYSDQIGQTIADLGFKAMLTEGAKHILGWKSPNYLYVNAINPRLKVLMRNFKLSDDIAFRFSNQGWNEYPLTADKYVRWINAKKENEIFNLFMDYETFGEHQGAETGIFKFLEALPDEVIKSGKLQFATPSEIAENFQPVSAVNVPHTISWADEERDLTAWLGNQLQNEAFDKLYDLSERMQKVTDPDLVKDFNFLQASDHFYYMCTKFFSDGEVHKYFNPYETPYEAFINYMNILNDFSLRLDKVAPTGEINKEIKALKKVIEEKDKKLSKYEAELKALQSKTKPTPVKKAGKK